MATERARTSDPDLSRFLAWLDEQRRLDHERLIQLAQLVEEQRVTLREHDGALASFRPAGSAKPGPESKDGGPSRVAEHLVLVERALDEHIETQSRSTQADAAVRERERRAFSELVQQTDNLQRALESTTGRIQALGEEIRRERDARAPVTQLVDELGRGQSAVQNRVASLEQVVRRATTSQALAEQVNEKQAAEIARLDNQYKLFDLRFSREIAEIRKVVDEWRSKADEQLKPVESVARQLALLIEQRDAVLERLSAIDQIMSEVQTEVNRLDATSRADRAATDRVAETLDAHARRWEASGGSIWQLGERLTALVDELAMIRVGERALREEINGIIKRLDRVDDEGRRLESVLVESATHIRAVEREAHARAEGIDARIERELASVTERADARFRLSVEHLGRIVGELEQQHRELANGSP